MKITDADLIRHCEEPDCSLGSVEYTCPACGKGGTSYDLWWKVGNGGLDAQGEEFQCEHCQAFLVIFWDQEELSARVRPLTLPSGPDRLVMPQAQVFNEMVQVFNEMTTVETNKQTLEDLMQFGRQPSVDAISKLLLEKLDGFIGDPLTPEAVEKAKLKILEALADLPSPYRFEMDEERSTDNRVVGTLIVPSNEVMLEFTI